MQLRRTERDKTTDANTSTSTCIHVDAESTWNPNPDHEIQHVPQES